MCGKTEMLHVTERWHQMWKCIFLNVSENSWRLSEVELSLTATQ
jgi:hypothetical protein